MGVSLLTRDRQLRNHVYNCSWSIANDTFQLWLRSDPDVHGTGKDLEEAEEALRDLIADTCGTNQASLEFIPPPPKSDCDQKYAASNLVLVSDDQGFDANAPRGRAVESDDERLNRLTWHDQFYEGGICKSCLEPNGPRTGKPLAISSTGNSYDGGFTDSFGRALIRIFSSSFLQLLSDHEKSHLQFRPIQQTKKTQQSPSLSWMMTSQPHSLKSSQLAALPKLNFACPVNGGLRSLGRKEREASHQHRWASSRRRRQ